LVADDSRASGAVGVGCAHAAFGWKTAWRTKAIADDHRANAGRCESPAGTARGCSAGRGISAGCTDGCSDGCTARRISCRCAACGRTAREAFGLAAASAWSRAAGTAAVGRDEPIADSRAARERAGTDGATRRRRAAERIAVAIGSARATKLADLTAADGASGRASSVVTADGPTGFVAERAIDIATCAAFIADLATTVGRDPFAVGPTIITDLATAGV
jgi:hypothetical protein